MADPTFLDTLSQINMQNFLGGIAKGGEAYKEQRQNENLVGLYDQFKSKVQGLKTTDEMLTDFQKEVDDKSLLEDQNAVPPDVQKGISMMKIIDRMGALTNTYQPFITAFATLGDDGVKIATTLSNELETKLKQEETKMKVPIMEQEMALNNAKLTGQLLNNDLSKLQYDQAVIDFQKNRQAQTLLTDMFDSDEGKNLWGYLTGIKSAGTYYKDDPKAAEAVKTFMDKFGKLPGFDTAFGVFANNPKVFRRDILVSGLTGGNAGGVTKEDNQVITDLSKLGSMTMFWNQFHTSKGYPFQQARDIFYQKSAGDPNKAQGLLSGMADDDQVKMTLKDFIQTFKLSGKSGYQTLWNDLKIRLGKKGRTLDPTFVLPLQGGVTLRGRDLLMMDENGNAVYEPYRFDENGNLRPEYSGNPQMAPANLFRHKGSSN